MKNKVWKPVKGYEEYYEVSTDGEIRTIERHIVFPTYSYLKKQKLLKQFVDGRGYMHVKLYDGKGKPKSMTTHKVVAITFLENPENLPEINHKDANKLNNCLSNLEWMSRGDNIKHAYKHRDPKTYKGSGNKLAKLTEEQVIEIRKERELYKTTYEQLAKKYNVGITLIGYIVNRKTWRHV